MTRNFGIFIWASLKLPKFVKFRWNFESWSWNQLKYIIRVLSNITARLCMACYRPRNPSSCKSIVICQQIMGVNALFAWLISHGWKYCWLIYCKRKILFVGCKNTAYKLNEQGVKLISQKLAPNNRWCMHASAHCPSEREHVIFPGHIHIYMR